MSRIFLDTNVLVYAHDAGSPLKHDLAKRILRELRASEHVSVLSTQVLQAFYNALVSKLRISRQDARERVHALDIAETVSMAPAMVHAAIDLHDVVSISFWDALIVIAAQHAGCQELWSEDLQAGRAFGSLRVVNPFATPS